MSPHAPYLFKLENPVRGEVLTCRMPVDVSDRRTHDLKKPIVAGRLAENEHGSEP
jgi:hypothetical protein